MDEHIPPQTPSVNNCENAPTNGCFRLVFKGSSADVGTCGKYEGYRFFRSFSNTFGGENQIEYRRQDKTWFKIMVNKVINSSVNSGWGLYSSGNLISNITGSCESATKLGEYDSNFEIYWCNNN